MKRNWLLGGLGLLTLAVVGRLLPHAANVTPLFAVTLIACAYLPRRWAVAVPVLAMMGSDLIIGLHSGIAFTWTGMLVFVLLGYGLRGRTGTLRILGSAVLGSVIFFIWTNFGVWLVGGLYPHTAAGLAQCFVAALPFLRNSLLGNVAFTGLLFAAYEWYRVRRSRSVAVSARV